MNRDQERRRTLRVPFVAKADIINDDDAPFFRGRCDRCLCAFNLGMGITFGKVTPRSLETSPRWLLEAQTALYLSHEKPMAGSCEF
jgi:hypothetical protein